MRNSRHINPLLALGILVLIPAAAMAMTVTLAWDANDEPHLAGYRIFMRTAGERYNYVLPEWEGTETTATIWNLDERESYFFVARAFDAAGNESGDSNEVFLAEVQGDGQFADTGSSGCLISSLPGWRRPE